MIQIAWKPDKVSVWDQNTLRLKDHEGHEVLIVDNLELALAQAADLFRVDVVNLRRPGGKDRIRYARAFAALALINLKDGKRKRLYHPSQVATSLRYATTDAMHRSIRQLNPEGRRKTK